MIKAYQSDTGQYVVVHELSDTVILDDDLTAAFQKLKQHLEKCHPEMAAHATQPFEERQSAAPKPRMDSFFMRTFLILLPFLWLAILHFSLGSLIDQFMVRSAMQRGSAEHADKGVQANLDALSVRMDSIEKRITPAK